MLSVYIDLDPSRVPPETRASQLGSLLDAARRQTAVEEADRVEAWLSSEPTIARGARGLAIFSSRGGHLLEVVLLTKSGSSQGMVSTIDRSRRTQSIHPGLPRSSRAPRRLLMATPQASGEIVPARDQRHCRHAQGGWSQARFPARHR